MRLYLSSNFGRCRCWAALLAAWATCWAMTEPGRWMGARLFMPVAPRCIWPIAMGLNHVNWRLSLADLIGLAGRPTAVGCAFLYRTPRPNRFHYGKCLPIAPIHILCCLAGTTRPANVAAIG